MRNIFLFLRRYFTFICFVVLQLFALWMLFHYNRFHHAVFLGVANEVTGRVNTQVDKLDDYFHQGAENVRVHRMNDSLLNLLKSNFNYADTAQRNVTDSLRQDSTIAVRRYLWRDAKVVYNTVNAEQNYLQLNRGSKYGIKDDMAVLNSDGSVVGVVVNVSPNFSQVMSLLHVQSSVSASHKATGTLGKVEWDGKDPRFVQLKGIPQSVPVKAGDSIMTSRYSYNFPPAHLIGTISEIKSDPSTGFYVLKVKTAANFSAIQQVFVVENLQREEQLQLTKDTEKKMEEQKNKKR
ncbi:rod shape-determining protein MreC [Flavisolibacter ginsenosidimutans]|uniref:Cell shape-determining protein MreC n=1 Tax=Flavisolibacter ginsenosidimutans TaxID=661481 RepID=A0A5B8ULM7_9BACT|nr:rod shape-determining protein MreC [Flavisolibacter ginsenosidimutans]QEC57473.1 rod shape-determining protein MreC [Flavisolibacter ginsenosidimutans]